MNAFTLKGRWRMKLKTIMITEKDKTQLQRLMLFGDSLSPREKKKLLSLNHHVNQGIVVPENAIPDDVVGIHSRIELQEMTWKIRFNITLVFPEDVDETKNRISILTPIGMALMGARTGDIIEYRSHREHYRLMVKKSSQPRVFVA
jgi:regulator of nucleoside diphosphate kinase